MSVHHRSPPDVTSDGLYHPITQEPPDADESTRLSEDLVLEDEETLADDFVAQEIAVAGDSRVRWIHFILGCAVLLPWNALITATPYFLSRLEGSTFKSTFGSYLSTTFTLANFLVLAHATATSKQDSNARRAILSLSWLSLLTFMLTVSTYTHVTPGLFFSFVLLNGIAQAAAGSYLQTAIVAVASLFGPSAMQAVMSGQAAVGVAVSGVQVISAAASVRGVPSTQTILDAEPEERSARVFFALSTVFLIVSAGAHAWLTHLPAYKFVVGQFKHIDHVVHGDSEDVYEGSNLVGRALTPARGSERRDQIWRIAKGNAIYNVAVAYVFVVTLAVFPPITMSILPTNPSTHPLLFSAIHFFIFNIGDFCGRFICSFPRLLVWSANRLLILSAARTLFIPLFLMCNIQRSSNPLVASSGAVINSDILYMLILLLFGLSNGYVSSLCMMSAPSVEHNPRLKGRVEDVDVAATVASFFLVGGLAIGSFASFAVRAAICDCNPFRE